MKVCKTCRLSLPIDAFGIRKSEADGRNYNCLECAAAYQEEWKRNHPDRNREHKTRYWGKHRRRILDASRDVKLRWTREHKQAVRAEGLLKRAVERGEVKRGVCEACGAVRVHGHHDDYAKPLEVRWFCSKHHRLHHARLVKEK